LSALGKKRLLGRCGGDVAAGAGEAATALRRWVMRMQAETEGGATRAGNAGCAPIQDDDRAELAARCGCGAA
jgi:hypothetical protein